MDHKERVTVLRERGNLQTLPFRPVENHLSTSIAWEEWLEEIEREFRYFKIHSPMDKKDALIIYGGEEIPRLEKALPNPEGNLNDYMKLRIKLNEYFLPKRNKLYARYIFMQIRPLPGETTISYATRLREKTHKCEFDETCGERILEHLIQTIENELLIKKCIMKEWSLSEFLREAQQLEEISMQIDQMKYSPNEPKIAKIGNKQYAKPLNFKQRQGQSEGIVQTCGYCGLSGVHRKGEGCPAYRKRCFICHMKDHFAVVCKRRRYYYSALRYRPCFTMHKSKQKDSKVKKSTELEPATTDSRFSFKSVGHLRIMEAKKIREKEDISQNIRSSEAISREYETDLYMAKEKFIPWNEPDVLKCQRKSKRQKLIAPEESSRVKEKQTRVHHHGYSKQHIASYNSNTDVEWFRQELKKWKHKYSCLQKICHQYRDRNHRVRQRNSWFKDK